ncbi:unnamed protein product [Ceratitis capitata]|uniref:(Mediterranean fruit fly) hypothetical protein n=1 Tax=Ceratitis capitata TaxID=7213 RepID=A0A811UYD5_CERCA|nr:unnamed protein product [Ceratitis capitata]
MAVQAENLMNRLTISPPKYLTILPEFCGDSEIKTILQNNFGKRRSWEELFDELRSEPPTTIQQTKFPTTPTIPTTIPTIPTIPKTIPTTPTIPTAIPTTPTIPTTISTTLTILTTIPTTPPIPTNKTHKTQPKFIIARTKF